jgi:hypothetical protein
MYQQRASIELVLNGEALVVLLGWQSHQGDRQPLHADRLILMGVWRDPSQPRSEETGAIGYCLRSVEATSAAHLAEEIVCSLDTGSANGCQRFTHCGRVTETGRSLPHAKAKKFPQNCRNSNSEFDRTRKQQTTRAPHSNKKKLAPYCAATGTVNFDSFTPACPV